jgi:hypothetical protein
MLEFTKKKSRRRTMPIGYKTNLKRIEALIGKHLRGPDWYAREIQAGVPVGFVLRTLYSAQVGRRLKRHTYRQLGLVFGKPAEYFYDLEPTPRRGAK